MAKTLIIIGVIFIAIGLAWWARERLGLGRLPGDIVIETGRGPHLHPPHDITHHQCASEPRSLALDQVSGS